MLVEENLEKANFYRLKMQIFQFGHAVMIVLNRLPGEIDEEAQNKLLASIGDDVINAAQQRKIVSCDE